jgi:peptide/nickel transport system substrate-binding protein
MMMEREENMKRACLPAIIVTATLLFSAIAPIFATGPTQPPVDTSTLYVGTIAWGPRHADPVRAYDAKSWELISNVYETLFRMDVSVSNQFGNFSITDAASQVWKFLKENGLKAWNILKKYGWIVAVGAAIIESMDVKTEFIRFHNKTRLDLQRPGGTKLELPGYGFDFEIAKTWSDKNNNGWLDCGDYIVICVKVDTVLFDAFRCRFVAFNPYNSTLTVSQTRIIIQLDKAIKEILKFFDPTGGRIFDLFLSDIKYSFERGLVQDQYGSPMWMFYQMFFGEMNSDFWDTGDPEDAWVLSHLINNAIEITGEYNITMNITELPEGMIAQILSGPWASIMSKEWCISKGCWDGELFSDDGRYPSSVAGNNIPDWFESWRHCAAFGYRSPIDDVKPENYAGTGPYCVKVASAAQYLVVLERNPNYWRGWPAPGRKAYLDYVDIEYIADWATREAAFLAGQLDVCAVPRANMMELLDPNDPARMITIDPSIITIKNIQPVLAMDAVFFTFTVNPESTAIYSGKFPDGIPTNFFNNTHVRKAFAYAFDHGKYINDVWLGEGICRETPLIYGLVPDYYTKGPDPPWTYNKDLTKVVEELQKAYFVQGTENKSVWDWGGFKISIYYNSGNVPRQLACEYIKATFDYINSVYGKNFIIDIQGPDWATYLEMLEAMEMPLYSIGWLADFADADNWVRPYMHSYGDFSYFQNYTAWNGWTTPGPRTGLDKDTLIDLALSTPDGEERATYYADLDDIYIMGCPSFPICQPFGRVWMKYWVKGWYYNGLYSGYYYYHLYKEDSCWADVTGPTVGRPDGVCNMRDVGYIAQHFGARAPDPSYDPKWAPGSYGCGGADVYGDRKVDMRDIGLACRHFGHTTQP